MPNTANNFIGFPDGGYPERFKPLIAGTVEKILAELTDEERSCIEALNPDEQIGRFEANIRVDITDDVSVTLKCYCGNLGELRRITGKVKSALEDV